MVHGVQHNGKNSELTNLVLTSINISRTRSKVHSSNIISKTKEILMHQKLQCLKQGPINGDILINGRLPTQKQRNFIWDQTINFYIIKLQQQKVFLNTSVILPNQCLIQMASIATEIMNT